MKGKKIRGKEGMKVNAGQDGWSRADQRRKKKEDGGRKDARTFKMQGQYRADRRRRGENAGQEVMSGQKRGI